MYTPPPPVNPDEHLMQERARQDALDADDRRGRSREGTENPKQGRRLGFYGSWYCYDSRCAVVLRIPLVIVRIGFRL